MNLKVLGILLNGNDTRINLSKVVSIAGEKIGSVLDTTVFKTSIRRAVSMGELPKDHIGITEYDPKSKVADDIRKVSKEFVQRLK